MSDSTNITKRLPTACCSAPIFSSTDELISNQGDVAVIIDKDPDKPGHFYISAYKTFNTANMTDEEIPYSYLTVCNLLNSQTSNLASSTYLSHSTNIPCSTKSSMNFNSSHTLSTSPQTLLYPVLSTNDDK